MGGKTSQAPEKINVANEAEQQYQARAQYDPLMAQQAFQIAADPKYGMMPFTQLQETTRRDVMPNETQARDQAVQNILASLISPTGATPAQEQSKLAIRNKAQDNLQEAMRGRQNLSGNLFGGRSAAAEASSVGDLQNQFATEDVESERVARLNAIQSLIPFLQILYPGINISSPQYTSAVASPDTTYQGAVSQSNLAAQVAQQQQDSQNALYASLFKGLGGAAGGALGGAFGAGGVWNKK
jgi:hypothetical protein